ncbi:MAG: polysaccharide biosynthesis/export family protein [Gammaproteobacteria bacterium]
MINSFKKFFSLVFVLFFMISCSIGTSFKSTQIKLLKGVYIPELSVNPILIESISTELIEAEALKKPLNLPMNLLKYEPNSYKVGAGDKLFIYVYGETERLSAALARGAAINPIFEKIVRDDGTIFYPNAGILDVSDKTIEEIRLLLTKKLSNVLNNPQVDVSVSEFKSKKIIVSGNFANVGAFPITTVPKTLSETIATANPYGINGQEPLGDLTSISLTREGLTYEIDYEYLTRNSQIQNFIYMKNGDVIHLPDNSLNQVHVLGEASNPTSINIKRKYIPLSAALAQAKGLNQSTSKGKEVFILRSVDYKGKPRIFKADISSPTGYLLAGKFDVQAQDIIFIGTAGITSWSRFINQVLPFTDFINSAEDTNLITN